MKDSEFLGIYAAHHHTLGKTTWFCSFLAAQTQWIHLIKILGRLIDNKDYTLMMKLRK